MKVPWGAREGILSAKLEHDVDYGIDLRSGYSVCVNGHYLVQLEPWLLVALWKAWRQWKAIRRDMKSKGLKGNHP